MINKFIAYNKSEIEKKKVISESKKLFKNKVIDQDQFEKINNTYNSKIYEPPVIMKLALFIISVIGLSFFLGFTALFGIMEYRILILIFGVILLIFVEKILIKDNFHFKSGVAEAGIYGGLLLVVYGVLGFETSNILYYFLVGFLFTVFAAVRYLDMLASALAVVFLGSIVYKIIIGLGGFAEALLPFIFMTFFVLIFWASNNLEKKYSNIIYQDQFLLLKFLSLIFFYVAGNYFVVRKLSVLLMDLDLAGQDDIPFAWVFYLFTLVIPIGYLIWGIKTRSIMFIRIALLTITLTLITFQYYFFPHFAMATLTLSGGFLIILALMLFKYLKQIRSGFTSEKLLDDTWDSKNSVAVIASQTLGGNATNLANCNTEQIGFKEGFGGGNFGGGGAEADW